MKTQNELECGNFRKTDFAGLLRHRGFSYEGRVVAYGYGG
jgi:hypothetical protein